MQPGPHSIWLYLPRLEANATTGRIHLRCFESGNGDRAGRRREWGPHLTLVTPRDDEAYEIIGSHVPAPGVSLARASVRREPVDLHRRDEGLSALICGERGFATMSRCGRSKSMSPQIQLASRPGGPDDARLSDYVLSCVSESAGYIIYDGCKCNILTRLRALGKWVLRSDIVP